jgi:predicted Co/Zn/Cd cation transporter (cation efflux family)
VGSREGSPLATAEGQLWIVEGWLALGVFVAFVASIALSRVWKLDASAYVDPAVCIVPSLVFLKKPFDILRESISDLVDANPDAEAVNAVEASARAVAERFHLKGVEWVRVRKAGRRVFVTVSFFEDPGESLQGMDQVRQAVIDDVVRLNPDVDVVVVFRPAPRPRRRWIPASLHPPSRQPDGTAHLPLTSPDVGTRVGHAFASLDSFRPREAAPWPR